MYNDNRGVSKIIGVVILVVIVIMLSVGVLFTAQTLIGGQPQDMTAGTTDERVDFYTHEAQLVNQGNTDTVYAISPLGTEYELNSAGDLQKILPLAQGSHPAVDQYQIVGEREGQRQLLRTSHFEDGVKNQMLLFMMREIRITSPSKQQSTTLMMIRRETFQRPILASSSSRKAYTARISR